jgi:hypothetical protein
MTQMETEKGQVVIELQLERAGQLFDTLDPTPFREKDLDREAEDYIVSWARELPRTAAIRIRVHLPAAEAQSEQAKMLPQALGRYFSYRADVLGRDLGELFRIGRLSLLVGLIALGLCVSAARIAAERGGQFGDLLREGLIIMGWVANWRPIEIFLYEWWPIVRHRNLLKRLSKAEITVVARQSQQG